MGYYYEQEPAPDDDRPPGCLDVLIITRAAFAVIMWPALVFLLGVLSIGFVFWTFSIHPALALVPLTVIGIAIWAYARWEQRHFRPPDA